MEICRSQKSPTDSASEAKRGDSPFQQGLIHGFGSQNVKQAFEQDAATLYGYGMLARGLLLKGGAPKPGVTVQSEAKVGASGTVATRTNKYELSPNVDVQFIQEARGGSIKPTGFVTTESLDGLSATEANILTGADYPVGTKLELVKARLPLTSLEKPTSGNRLFRYNTGSLLEGSSITGLKEYRAPYIPKQNVYHRIELGEVLQNIP